MASSSTSSTRTGSDAGTNRVAPPGSGPNRLFVVAIVAVAVLGLAVVAVLATNRGDGASTVLAEEATAPVTVEGTALEVLGGGIQISDPATDPTIGQVAPTLTGTDLNGDDLTIGPDGTAKVIYFLAHWCGNCQAEVPVLQELIDDGAVPSGVEVYAVSTGVDEGRGNFPPQEWLSEEGFTPPTLRDDDESSAARAFGVSGFPFAVYLDAEHRVILRTTGALPDEVTTTIWDELAAG
jgi:thiol-disulfide isomerase/thioredoxin